MTVRSVNFFDNRFLPVMHNMQRTPWVAKTRIGENTIGELLASQQLVRIRTAEDGKISVQGANAAGGKLLSGEHGAQVAQRIRAIASAQANAHGSGSTLDGVILSVGSRTITFNWDNDHPDARQKSLNESGAAEGVALLNVIGQYAEGLSDDLLKSVKAGRPLFRIQDMQDLRDDIKTTAEEYGNNTSSAFGDGLVVFGGYDAGLLRTPSTKGSRSSEDATWITQLALHETEHVVTPWTPTTMHDNDYHSWIEEGVADTMADWPGRVHAVGKAAGLDTLRQSRIDHDHEYYKYSSAIRHLLRLSGIPIISPTFDKAAALIQGVPADQVPTQFAQAIAQRWNLNESKEQKIAELIDTAQGDPSVIDAIDKMVHE